MDVRVFTMARPRNERVILLAEDDVSVRNLVRHVLENAGFLILPAADGIEALTFLRAYPKRIDVLLADIDMPLMDGITLAEHVRQERPDVIVLLMSARAPAHVCLEDLGVEFLQKPFAPEALITRIERLITSTARDEAP
jgi:CheY-like chemotaxis protein